MAKTERLAKNFHQTFRPERIHITAILRFAAKGGSGTDQEIGKETGIPTGQTSGKVPVTIDYAEAMGLIKVQKGQGDKVKCPELTEFGRILLLEDPYMKTEVSQWLMHLQLCGKHGGADIWYQLFCTSIDSLQIAFSLKDVEEYFERKYGVNKTKFLSPMLNCYTEDSSLKICGALSREDNSFIRHKAPISEEMTLAYGAWVLLLLERWFPNDAQVPVDDFETTTGWSSIAFWDREESKEIIDRVAERGLISVDRHMKPWLISAIDNSSQALKMIYDDLI